MELKIGDTVLFKIRKDKQDIYNPKERSYNKNIGILKTISNADKLGSMGDVDFHGYIITNIYFTDLVSVIDSIKIIETGLDILALKYEN